MAIGIAETTLYTVPGATTAVIRNIRIVNSTSGSVTVKASIGADAIGTRVIASGFTIPANGDWDWSGFLFLAAADTFGDERYRAVAEAVGDRGIQAIHLHRSPWPCGVVSGGETPGLLLGTAGIGHFYLRLYDSRGMPSVLLM